jgi:hypothetical protein
MAFNGDTSTNVGVKYELLSETTLSNTTTETVLGTYTMPANYTVAGSHYRIIFAAQADYIATSGTLTFRLRAGGVAGTFLQSWVVSSQVSAGTLKNMGLTADLVCRSVASGTATWTCSGFMLADTGPYYRSTGTATSTTTANSDLVFTAQWATANAGNVLRAEILTIQKVA